MKRGPHMHIECNCGAHVYRLTTSVLNSLLECKSLQMWTLFLVQMLLQITINMFPFSLSAGDLLPITHPRNLYKLTCTRSLLVCIGVARGASWGPSPPKGVKKCTTVLAVQQEQIYMWKSYVFVFGRISALDPAEGAYDAPPDSLVGWGGGHPYALPPRCLRCLGCQAPNTNFWLCLCSSDKLFLWSFSYTSSMIA